MSLDYESVFPHLQTRIIGRRQYAYAEEMPSTNRIAAQMAASGAESGSLAVCDRQTQGRGRMSRSWDSTSHEDIAVSVLWRLRDISKAPFYPLAAALAVQRELSSLTDGASIKWPNDVLLHGRKVCGILCELHGDAAVIGIGVNVNRNRFPEELSGRASSLKIETEQTFELPRLLASLFLRLEEALIQLEQEGFPSLLADYRPLCATLKRPVRVLSTLGEWRGFAEDIDGGGRLLVRNEAGELIPVDAADVSVRGLMGYVDQEGNAR